MKQQHQQVANSISGNNNGAGPALLGSRFDALGMGRMELGAVATAAGLTEAEVMDLVGGRTESYGPTNGRADDGFFTRSTIPHDSAAAAAAGAASTSGVVGGPYSRVSPSTFSAFSSNQQQPLSPSSAALPAATGFAAPSQQQQQQQYPAQYANVNSNVYGGGAQSAPSPYSSVPFVDGGLPRQGYPAYPQQQQQQGLYQSSPYDYQQQQQQQQQVGGALEESFANLAFSGPASSALLPARQSQESTLAATSTAASTGSGTPSSAPSSSVGVEGSGYLSAAPGGGGALTGEERSPTGVQWGAWNGPRDVQA